VGPADPSDQTQLATASQAPGTQGTDWTLETGGCGLHSACVRPCIPKKESGLSLTRRTGHLQSREL
jgi:hypothetical protein